MDTFKNHIIKKINNALGTDFSISLLNYPPKAEMGDLTFSLFEVARKEKKNPKEIGETLISKIKCDDIITDIKITGSYLNFFINKKYLAKNTLSKIAKEKNKYGNNKNLKGKKIMVEFAHPNPFKSFHVGHLRNILLGESIVRLLECQGAKVIRTNYQGDVGMHIAKCLWAFSEISPRDYPKTADEKVALLGKCYAKGAKAFEEDEKIKQKIKEINKKIYSNSDKKIKKLWDLGKKWSLEKFHEIYERVYSTFSREYMESEVIKDAYNYIEQAKKKGILKESEGAVIFDGKKHGLETRVFLNSEGLPTYDGKELALAYKQFSDFGKIDLCIHNVAVEQIGYFKVNFKVQDLLDEKRFKGKQYHNAYEFVGLKKGKMSSRKGKVVLGNDILNEAHERIAKTTKEKSDEIDVDTIEKVAISAIKYAFLKISPFKYLAFDMEESVSFSGDSGPYLEYTYARIQSILRKIKNYELKIKNLNFDKLNKTEEIELIKQLAKYPEIVEVASKNYDPSEIAKYLFDLAKLFNDYYHKTQILKSEDEIKKVRLILISAVKQILKNGLYLLGIKTVEKM